MRYYDVTIKKIKDNGKQKKLKEKETKLWKIEVEKP